MSSSIKFLKKFTKRGNKSSDQLRSASTSVESKVGQDGSGKQEGEIAREGISSSVITTSIHEPSGPKLLTSVPTESDGSKPHASVLPVAERPKTRIELAHSELLVASSSLSSTLSDYFAGSSESYVPPSDFALDCPFNPENFGAAVECVLLTQQNQSPTIASKVGSAISKIYPLASLTLGLAASASESAALTPVKGAINSLSLLLTLADQEQGRGEDFLKQLDRIQYQSLRVAEVQKHSDLEIGELLLEKSTNLMTAVIRFLKSSIIFFRHDYFYNLGKTVLLGPKIYSDARAELELAIAEYDQAMLLQITIKILAMSKSTASPPPDQKFLQSSLATWLKSSYWPVDAQFTNNCELRAPGTLQWVLEAEEFKAWRLGDSKCLWLHGLPGVGKSVITAYLIQILKAQHPDAVVLYFFCKAGDSTLDNVDKLIRTLAIQLALAAPEARKKLQELKEEGFESSDAYAYTFSRLVKDTIAVVLRPIFVIIDGLDECFAGEAGGGNAVETLLDGLKKLEVKLLVSSRPTPEISQGLGWGPKRLLTFEDSRDDIKLYVAMRVNKSKGLQKGFARINNNASDFLSEKSQGNFLWVVIVLNLLERAPSAKVFQKTIETLPKGIVGVYDRVLDKLIAAETFEMASAILVCVLFSFRPMTIMELQVAIGLLLDEVLDLQDFVESNCGSFLGIVPAQDGPSVHIVHETFRSYITDPTVSQERCLLPSRSHMRLATACLGCLIEPGDDDQANLRQYATWHWFQHFNDSRESEKDIAVLGAMLVKVHAFVTNTQVVTTWMRDVISQSAQRVRVREQQGGCFIADIHHGIMDWLQSDILEKLAQSEYTDGDEDLEEALVWRTKVLSDDLYLARLIVGNLAFTWLNTNWGEVVMSRTAFAHALAAARILQLVEPKEFVPPSEWFNFENRTPKIPDSAKSKPGWTWRYATYGSFHCHLLDLTEQHINTLAMLGGYNSSIGLQSGNYAFGALVAGLDTCIQQFQAAIDEHPVWWHLHEGLGDWYYQSDEKEKAVQCYSEALKFDPKKTPSCAIDYWTLVSKIKKNSGDIEGAVQALRTGASLVPEKDAYTYWSTMGDIYKEQKEWKSAQSLYREAIDKNPSQCKNYWEKLASIHDNTLDWKGKMETYIEAMARDPDNIKSYADSLRLMAQRFTFDQLFEPALLILQNCIDHHPTHADTYKMKMAGCHMAACNWKAAVDLYEAIRSGPNAHDSEFSYLNEDLGHAYLGMGETTRALAAYQEKRMERLATGDVSGNSSDAAYIHMIEGDFGLAIRQIKADITETQKRFPNGAESWRIAVTHLDSYRDLGICYEAVGRMDDARVSFQSAVNTFERFVTELEPFVHTDNNTPYYRTSARALLAYGLMLEKVGRLEDASRIYEGAAHRYERTTFVGDDAPLNWEKEQAALALQRVNSPDRQAEMPSLLEEIGGPQLELRLCLGYRTSYGAKENSRAPRFRCGKSGYAATMLKDSFST